MTPAMAPATKTGLEVAPTFSTSLAALPSPVIVRILVKYVLVRWAGPKCPWDRPSGAKAGLSQRARWRSGIFRGCLLPARLGAERETAPEIDVDHYRVAGRDLATQQVLGELVFDPARDHPAQRPGPEDAVVALQRCQEGRFRFRREIAVAIYGPQQSD